MSDLSYLLNLTNADKQEKLNNVREKELKKLNSLQCILSIVKSSSNRKFDIPDQENLKRAIKIISVQNYLKMENELNLLGLNDIKIDLSYTERKAIRNFIIAEISKKCAPVVEFVQTFEKENPNIFKQKEKQLEILALEEKRRNLYLELAEVKNKKCGLLKICAELKMGPYLHNELEILKTKYRLNQNKVNLLEAFIKNDFYNRTEYTEKALTEVVKFIDAELEE